MAPPAGKVEKNTEQTPATARRGIQSIEVGFRILDVIRQTGRPMPLKEIADACELTVPNVHYYLVSFQKVGVVQQHADTGHYGLGPYALRLGLAALEQFDVFTTARPIMAEVAAATGHTVFLGVWGNKGPTIVYRVEGSRSRPLLELRVGTVMPLLSSALGRNFLAHLPAAITPRTAGTGDGLGHARKPWRRPRQFIHDEGRAGDPRRGAEAPHQSLPPRAAAALHIAVRAHLRHAGRNEGGHHLDGAGGRH